MAKFWVLMVEDWEQLETIRIIGGINGQVSTVEHGTIIATREQDIPVLAKALANKFPNRDVHVFTQTEAYYAKATTPIRKVWENGELRAL